MKAKHYLSFIILVLFCAGCAPITKSNQGQETPPTTLSPVASTSPYPQEVTSAPSMYVEDPAALTDAPGAWPDTVTLPFIAYNENTEAFEESEATARKLVTPTYGFTLYYIDGFQYREKEGGVEISAKTQTESMILGSPSFTIYTYGSDKDIEAAFKYHLESSYAYSHVEEAPEDSAFDRIYHSVETGQNTGNRKIWVVFNTAGNPENEIMVAETYYHKDRPELLQNIYWMIKSFRK